MLELPFDDIQGIIVRGYTFRQSKFLFLQLTDAQSGQAWLAQIIDSVTAATVWESKPDTAFNIAFSAVGLKALGMSEATLKTFLPEFQRDIVGSAGVLGDHGSSAPENWDIGGTDPAKALHVLLMLYANTSERLDQFVQEHLDLIAKSGGKITVIASQDGHKLPGDKEHFGFQDGLSQPPLEGSKKPLLPGQVRYVKAGEFILGYKDEYDLYPDSPILQGTDVSRKTKLKDNDFGFNGSYLVYRKLVQDVAGFWKFIYAHTQTPEEAEHLAAKFLGRWRSGAPLTLTPDHDDPELGGDRWRNNNFNFKPNDADGYGCPVGSHIRRANPRNGFETDPVESSVFVERHRILRRGIPYGDPIEDFTEDDGKERGLVFLAINTNINRQFEFIQQSWLNNPKFNGLYDTKDPVLGDNDGTGHMVIPRRPFRKRIAGIPRFVTVKGGGYFFLPSMSALRWLANS